MHTAQTYTPSKTKQVS